MTFRPFFLTVLISLSLVSNLAEATLGEKMNSIQADRVQMKAVKKSATVSAKGYTVDESETGFGTVRQYYTPDGTVFAITWDGVSNPDLSVLLGSFNDRYLRALSEKPFVRRSRAAETRASGLVVRKSGHMRAYHGQIIATDLLPAGVTTEDLQ